MEGAALDVIAAVDLARLTPRVLVVETKYPERITGLPSGRMELINQLSVRDYLYRALSAESA